MALQYLRETQHFLTHNYNSWLIQFLLLLFGHIAPRKNIMDMSPNLAKCSAPTKWPNETSDWRFFGLAKKGVKPVTKENQYNLTILIKSCSVVAKSWLLLVFNFDHSINFLLIFPSFQIKNLSTFYDILIMCDVCFQRQHSKGKFCIWKMSSSKCQGSTKWEAKLHYLLLKCTFTSKSSLIWLLFCML